MHLLLCLIYTFDYSDYTTKPIFSNVFNAIVRFISFHSVYTELHQGTLKRRSLVALTVDHSLDLLLSNNIYKYIAIVNYP